MKRTNQPATILDIYEVLTQDNPAYEKRMCRYCKRVVAPKNKMAAKWRRKNRVE